MTIFFALLPLLLADENEANESEKEQTNTESKKGEAKADTQKESKPKAPIDISQAEEMQNLSRKQVKWLRPMAKRFEQNPYQHVDFTSYTLEWGEVQLGFNSMNVGVLPRTQIGTRPLLWATGLQNASAKTNVARVGAWDLAVNGSWLSLPSNEFKITYLGGGISNSLRILVR